MFVPEFATHVMNSPGEPGVSYHMGVGFPRSINHPFLTEMRFAAEQRTRQMLVRVNAYLDPVRLDFDRDVKPLTPKGNATERHLCEAYERKACEVFPEADRRAAFWTARLGEAPADSAKLQGLIRAKTMKQGGVGYVAPDSGSFPDMAKMNRFVIEAGAHSDHDLARRHERRRTADGGVDRDRQILGRRGAQHHSRPQLHARASKTAGCRISTTSSRWPRNISFPIIVGTEMNAPGQKFVDVFASAELKPLAPAFLRGACIVLCAFGSAARMWTRLPELVGFTELLLAHGQERFLRGGRARAAAPAPRRA